MKKLLLFFLSIALYCACTDDFLDKEPSNYSSQEKLLSTAQGVESALVGCYSEMQSYTYYGRNFVLFGDVYADNAKLSTLNTGNFSSFYNYSVTADDEDLKNLWSTVYRIISNADKIIAVGEDSTRTDLSPSLLGEALAIRSLAYFDLVRVFANKASFSEEGIPIANDTVPYPERSKVSDVYKMIIADLQRAESLLEDAVVSPYRFNKYSVQALLIIVYMYDNRWTKVIEKAESFLAECPYTLLTADNYIDSWSEESSTESIFSVAMSATDNAGTNSIGHMLSPDGYGGLVPTEDLLSLYSDNDVRTSFITKRSEKFFMKYPGRNGRLGVDNVPVIRLSEIYYILAECYLLKMDAEHSDYLDKAREIMSELTKRVDPSMVIDNLSPDDLYLKVYEEYRKEFAFEGKRFFQLKRSVFQFPISRTDCNSTICEVPNPSYMFALPLPLAELNANQNLSQNQGY